VKSNVMVRNFALVVTSDTTAYCGTTDSPVQQTADNGYAWINIYC